MPETPRVWAMTSQVPALGQSREILRLAVPAFLALVAEPLFLLADSAIIGQLGAGSERGALEAGIDGTWLAVVLGAITSVAVALAAAPLCRLFGASDAAIEYAATYLRVAAAGIPAMLVALAATGVLRGLQ